MKRSTKAALISLVVFPGAGHFYLKRWIPGLLLSCIAATALYFIVSVAGAVAMDIVGRIESGAVPLDPLVITELVSQQLQLSEQTTNTATLVLVATWLIGIVTSYLQARSEEASHEQL